jgi:hypothetical protein
MGKTAVLYVFHEITDMVRHFVQFCTFESPDVDFYVIANNLQIKFDLPPYVKTMNRTNIGYDFGAWSECLVNDDMYIKYDFFIFANSSIVGPFLPKNFNGRWTDIYINGLKDNVKLFGSTINATGDSRGAQHSPEVAAHIQSYIFSADREAVEYLMECEIFNANTHLTGFRDTIEQKEILMSRKIIDNGWNIGCLMKYYDGVDFKFKHKQPHEYARPFIGDIMFDNYYGKFWNEFEIVFVKGNRINVSIK